MISDADPEAASPDPPLARFADAIDTGERARTLNRGDLRRLLDGRAGPMPVEGVVVSNLVQRTTILRYRSEAQSSRFARRAIELGRTVAFCDSLAVAVDAKRRFAARAPRVQHPLEFLADHGLCSDRPTVLTT